MDIPYPDEIDVEETETYGRIHYLEKLIRARQYRYGPRTKTYKMMGDVVVLLQVLRRFLVINDIYCVNSVLQDNFTGQYDTLFKSIAKKRRNESPEEAQKFYTALKKAWFTTFRRLTETLDVECINTEKVL